MNLSYSARVLACAFAGWAASPFINAPRAQTSIAVVAPWEIGGADPAKTGHAFTRLEVAETLVDAAPDGRLTPGLATSWSVSQDDLLWRFELRRGVLFHDGTSMTAESVANSLRIAHSKPGVLRSAPIASIDAIGENAITIRLSRPFAILPAMLAGTSALVLAPTSFAASGEATQVIGTGPYMIDRFEPPQRMLMRRFDRYWGARPEVERTSYLAVGRGETRALMAESGDAQIVFSLDPASRTRLARSRRVEVHTVPVPRVLVIKVNSGHPFLSDPRAREALSLLIDRPGIAKALLRNPDSAATQLFPPSMQAWRKDDLAPFAQDIARAETLLRDLGWTRGADNVLMRDGKRFALTMRTFPDRPELPLVATALQDQFRKVGVQLRVALVNSSDIPAGHRDGTLELALIARNFGLVPDPLVTLLQDYGPNGGDWGAMNWTDERIPSLLAELLNEKDEARAEQLRNDVVTILHKELPVIPVAWHAHTAAVSRSVQNFSIDPFERSYRISQMRVAK
jgi:peptide/nickel transport system substrate-binding protein